MKRITLAMSLVLGCMMTTQSFGFDLLDRMMGTRGCGCEAACCDTPCCPVDPGCGCEAQHGCCPAPACGAEAACCPQRGGLLQRHFGGHRDPGCGCEPACCAQQQACCPQQACGCEVACDTGCGCAPQRGGLLSRLFARHHRSACDAPCCPPACEPACGCPSAPACPCPSACDAPCCPPQRGGLLSRLFGHSHGKSACCDMGCDACGSAGGGYAPAPSVHSVPEAPTPIADPSASYQSKRRVVQASARYVR